MAKKQYIGKYEVDTVTQETDSLLRVSFKPVSITDKDGEEKFYTEAPESMTQEMFDVVVTEEVSTPSELKEKRVNAVVKDVMKVLLKYNVYIGQEGQMPSELQYIWQGVVKRIMDNRLAVEQDFWQVPEYKLSALDVFNKYLDIQPKEE